MKEHKHKFKNIGGGCLIDIINPLACDDHYKCDCGLDFKLKTSHAGHRYLPEEFEVEEMSEIKLKEQVDIQKAIDDKLTS